MKNTLDFSEIAYDSGTICWPRGNDVVGPKLLARIKFSDVVSPEEKDAYDKAKECYQKYFHVGQRFKPMGDGANTTAECRITFIHQKKQSVTWKQDNLTEDQIKKGLKPAAGKWSINAMLQLHRFKKIEFI